MESDISKLHKGTDGFYYEDYIAPDKPETFVGKLVSTEWWHKGVRFALICNFQAEDGRRIALFVIVKTCSDIFYTIGQKKCPMPSAKIRNYSHSHNLVSQ